MCYRVAREDCVGVSADVLTLAFVAILVVVCVILLGVAAFIWARALAEVARAGAHIISAAEQKTTVDAGNKALKDLEEPVDKITRDYTPPPPDHELIEAVIASRAARENGQGRVRVEERVRTPFDPEEPEYSTTANEMRNPPADEQAIISPDHMYMREDA